jgi:hypothetical protein
LTLRDKFFVEILRIVWKVSPLIGGSACLHALLNEVTTVRLKVEQNQLVVEGWGCDLGAIGLQGA